jgi:hypothetical protein
MLRSKNRLVPFVLSQLIFALSLRAEVPKVDKRLLGVWLSDREMTIQHMRFKEGLSPEKKAKIADLFGKLRIEYTETSMRTEYEGNIENGPYKIVESDKDSVLIWGKDFESPKLIQIHFVGDSYYVLSGFNLEFFTRVKPISADKKP